MEKMEVSEFMMHLDNPCTHVCPLIAALSKLSSFCARERNERVLTTSMCTGMGKFQPSLSAKQIWTCHEIRNCDLNKVIDIDYLCTDSLSVCSICAKLTDFKRLKSVRVKIVRSNIHWIVVRKFALVIVVLQR